MLSAQVCDLFVRNDTEGTGRALLIASSCPNAPSLALSNTFLICTEVFLYALLFSLISLILSAGLSRLSVFWCFLHPVRMWRTEIYLASNLVDLFLLTKISVSVGKSVIWKRQSFFRSHFHNWEYETGQSIWQEKNNLLTKIFHIFNFFGGHSERKIIIISKRKFYPQGLIFYGTKNSPPACRLSFRNVIGLCNDER